MIAGSALRASLGLEMANWIRLHQNQVPDRKLNTPPYHFDKWMHISFGDYASEMTLNVQILSSRNSSMLNKSQSTRLFTQIFDNCALGTSVAHSCNAVQQLIESTRELRTRLQEGLTVLAAQAAQLDSEIQAINTRYDRRQQSLKVQSESSQLLFDTIEAKLKALTDTMQPLVSTIVTQEVDKVFVIDIGKHENCFEVTEGGKTDVVLRFFTRATLEQKLQALSASIEAELSQELLGTHKILQQQLDEALKHGAVRFRSISISF